MQNYLFIRNPLQVNANKTCYFVVKIKAIFFNFLLDELNFNLDAVESETVLFLRYSSYFSSSHCSLF